MTAHLIEWINYIVRWAHLIFGISWIGSSFYFMWLDSHLSVPKNPNPRVEGELWMVHSGGFYQVEKRKIAAGEMPQTLHWFIWEATFTWISGVFLLGLVYYLNNGSLLIDPKVSQISAVQAIGLSLGIMIFGWLGYDTLWASKLGQKPIVPTLISLLGLCAITYFLTKIYSGRGAFIHVGALLGTIMVANVWVRILPAQQQMIDATGMGLTPDFTLGLKAKRRSVHNSYMTFPVLFIMLSNHYPSTYGHKVNYLILILLMLLGGSVRHIIIAKVNGSRGYYPAFLSLLGLIYLTGPQIEHSMGPVVNFDKVKPIITQRCQVCHSNNPENKTFGINPGGANFDTPENIQAFAARIRFRAVETQTMPLNNLTSITEDERSTLKNWIDQGAKLQ